MKPEGITIIITVWKRGYLDQQLSSLIAQTVQPEQIWIIQNEQHIDIEPVVRKHRKVFPALSVIHSEKNLKYFGRFSICYHVETPYVLLIDDDVIPAPNWLQTCLVTSKAYKAIVSCTGRIVRPFNYRTEECSPKTKEVYFIGDNQTQDTFNYINQDTQVDYGCNSYFFKTEWIKYFWSVSPVTLQSGEDIHLSASLMISEGIKTIVPQQLTEATSGNQRKLYSQDMVSSWRQSNFIDVRETVFRYLIQERHWQPMLWAEQTLKLVAN